MRAQYAHVSLCYNMCTPDYVAVCITSDLRLIHLRTIKVQRGICRKCCQNFHGRSGNRLFSSERPSNIVYNYSPRESVLECMPVHAVFGITWVWCSLLIQYWRILAVCPVRTAPSPLISIAVLVMLHMCPKAAGKHAVMALFTEWLCIVLHMLLHFLYTQFIYWQLAFNAKWLYL